METDERHKQYLEHFSDDVSQPIKDYAIDEVMKFSRYIFTHRDGKQQFGYCTHCKTSFSTDRLRIELPSTIKWAKKKETERAECPNCKSKCTIKASGRGRKFMVDEALFEYYEKSIIDPSILVARGIGVTMDYRSSYENVKINYSTLALYVFQMGESIMLKQNYYGDGFFKTGSVYKNVEGYLNRLPYEFSLASLEKAVKDTPFQYSTWDKYSYRASSMLKFFNLYSKYPCIEYLTKEGFGELVEDKLWGRNTYSAVNWKADSIFKILKLNKTDLKELKACKYKDNSLYIRLYQMSKKDKSNLSLKEIEDIMKNFGSYFKELQRVHKYVTLRKIVNYTKQQLKKYPKQFHQKSNVLIAWKDYIADCKTLEMDLASDNVLFPRDVHASHQNTIKQIKLQADETLNIKIRARMKVLEKYCLEYNGLIIRPARSSNELIEEGKALSHCVGTYAGRHASGETDILFIRKVAEPDKSYYTVEVKKNIIIQVHGKDNRSADKEVEKFIKVFTKKKLTQKKAIIQNRITIPA